LGSYLLLLKLTQWIQESRQPINIWWMFVRKNAWAKKQIWEGRKVRSSLEKRG
jgi:hypothetical protein